MSPPINIDQFYAELEERGEDDVRKTLASTVIYGGDKQGLVEEWLRRKVQDREDSRNREEIEISRDCVNLRGRDSCRRLTYHSNGTTQDRGHEMAETVVHIGENSPEQVAYKLMDIIGSVEGKVFYQDQNSADRTWILDTYAECLLAVVGSRET